MQRRQERVPVDALRRTERRHVAPFELEQDTVEVHANASHLDRPLAARLRDVGRPCRPTSRESGPEQHCQTKTNRSEDAKTTHVNLEGESWAEKVDSIPTRPPILASLGVIFPNGNDLNRIGRKRRIRWDPASQPKPSGRMIPDQSDVRIS
jgi:hypothetical protein